MSAQEHAQYYDAYRFRAADLQRRAAEERLARQARAARRERRRSDDAEGRARGRRTPFARAA